MGDLIDGDQSYALLEAMHGWDHAVMYDMYTWDSLREIASSYDLEIRLVQTLCVPMLICTGRQLNSYFVA